MILFDNVLPRAEETARKFAAKIKTDIILVRDLAGRVSLLMEIPQDNPNIVKFSDELSRNLGKYAGSILTKESFEFLNPSFFSGKKHLCDEGSHSISLIERRIVGDDWYGSALQRSTKNPRACFFSIKGGVGRSTAAVHLAWQCARQGEKALLVDLDLESPGISSTIMNADDLPDYGILDWFVEDAVGQGEYILQRMVAESRLSEKEEGSILVAPVCGSETKNYLAKLSRCYAGTHEGNSGKTWAERLAGMIEQLEMRHRPDVTIIDSRAGVNDIAAAVATRLDCEVFLFALDTRQTWDAYESLFAAWHEHENLGEFRERFKMVRGLAQSDEGRQSFLNESSDVFSRNFYDLEESGTNDGWTFDVNEREAPHFPLTIYWHPKLTEFTPRGNNATGIDEQAAKTAYESFFAGARQFLMMDDAHE